MSFEYVNWPLPANVRAGWSTRQSGFSAHPFASNNIALHVADCAKTVLANRRLLQSRLQGQPTICWLNQTHSSVVVAVEQADLNQAQDGCFTRQKNIACCVMTADCLPVFMWSKNGEQIAAVHAGWRGLADGILLNALAQFDHPSQVVCGIGPAISQNFFEVGADVVSAFKAFAGYEKCFVNGNKPEKYYADLPALARAQLLQAGVAHVYLSNLCSYQQSEKFYSYRRDGQTGRMANLIWKTSI